MTSKMFSSRRESMLEEAINSVSCVRIGGKLLYFGEKGNAFSLSDKPPVMSAQSMPDLSRVSESCHKDSNSCGIVIQSTDDEGDEADSSKSSSSSSSTSSIIEYNATVSANSSFSSSRSSAASTPTGQRSPSFFDPPISPILSNPTPLEVGLPLKLPRPPAAHLPPPLPKRPPSGPPKTVVKRNTSSTFDTCSLPSLSRPHSPTFLLEKSTHKRNNNNDVTNFKTSRSLSLSSSNDTLHVTKHPVVSSPTFFRSSGTLTVSTAHDRSPREDDLGSPNSPQSPIISTSGSGLMTSSALVQLKKPFANMIQTTMGVCGPVAMETAKSKQNAKMPSQGMSQLRNGNTNSGTAPMHASANEQEGQRPATPDSGIDCHLDNKSHEPKRKLPSLDVADSKSRSMLPPELSSLCKGSMAVADLVAGAIVNYRSRPKDGKKAPPTPVHQGERYTSSQNPVEIGHNAHDAVHTSPSNNVKLKSHDYGSKINASVVMETDLKRDLNTKDRHNFEKDKIENTSMTTKDGKDLGTDERSRTPNGGVEASASVNGDFKSFRDKEKKKTKKKKEEGDEETERGDTIVLKGDEKRRESFGTTPLTSKNGHSKENDSKGIRDDRAAKKKARVRPRFENGPSCGQCRRAFGLRTSRHHCRRCWRSFCEKCLPIQRYDPNDSQDETSVMSRMCPSCSLEHAMESCRGRTRGLWSEFESLRKEARDSKGLEVTSKVNQDDRQQTIHDLTLLLRRVCVTFLVELQQQLERSRSKATTRLWESTTGRHNKGNKVKIKDPNRTCTACQRPLRYLTESRDCAVCGLHFCTTCTARTLQLYLPRGTPLSGDIGLDRIRFYIKQEESDEIRDTEVSETYLTCLECEDSADRFLKMLEFNQKIPDLETEMFDLQRHIEHALSYSPLHLGIQRSTSVMNLSRINEMKMQDSNMELAHRLYDRYLKLYGMLEKMKPATGIQMTLHKHIKQAMYNFYQVRRQQLQDALRRRGSAAQVPEFIG